MERELEAAAAAAGGSGSSEAGGGSRDGAELDADFERTEGGGYIVVQYVCCGYFMSHISDDLFFSCFSSFFFNVLHHLVWHPVRICTNMSILARL